MRKGDPSMYSEAGIGLANADHNIAQAETNLRQLGALIPHLARQGIETSEIQGQVEAMAMILDNLRSQRWQIEGLLGQP
jgi:hypothetical protein